jgi:XTP/dITP diphosphohydrolase
MRRLLLATTNPNKLREIRPLLTDLSIELITLADLPPIPEPEESGRTFWENARIKALAYAEASDLPTVAEDSGLEIDALDGEPGVLSARFLRPDTSYPERFAEIYRRLAPTRQADRQARFVTALAMAKGRELLFETETAVEGRIAPAPAGIHGFGYDPIFFYAPLGKTTAELTDQEKAVISHRARAFRNLRLFLTLTQHPQFMLNRLGQSLG